MSDDVCGNTNIVMKKMKHVCVMSYKLLEEGSADIDRIFNTAPLEKFCITSYDKVTTNELEALRILSSLGYQNSSAPKNERPSKNKSCEYQTSLLPENEH